MFPQLSWVFRVWKISPLWVIHIETFRPSPPCWDIFYHPWTIQHIHDTRNEGLPKSRKVSQWNSYSSSPKIVMYVYIYICVKAMRSVSTPNPHPPHLWGHSLARLICEDTLILNSPAISLTPSIASCWVGVTGALPPSRTAADPPNRASCAPGINSLGCP